MFGRMRVRVWASACACLGECVCVFGRVRVRVWASAVCTVLGKVRVCGWASASTVVGHSACVQVGRVSYTQCAG